MQNIIDGFFRFRRGSIDALDGITSPFVPLVDHLHVCATPAQLNVAA